MLAVVLAAALLAACSEPTTVGPSGPSSTIGVDLLPHRSDPLEAERDGIRLLAEMRADEREIRVVATVRNERDGAVHLVTSQCGRVVEVLLARTRLEPEGDRWSGTVQAAKDLILDRQLARQSPDRFVRALAPGTTEPTCTHLLAPVRLDPGEELIEEWYLDPRRGFVLPDVGAEGSAIRVEVIEARSPDELEFWDVVSHHRAGEQRSGRIVRVEEPASTFIRSPPPAADPPLSAGEVFDRLVRESDELRAWIEAQPPDAWRDGEVLPPFARFGVAELRLRLVAAGYERAARATATSDGELLTLELPGPADVAREFARRAATLPPGIRLQPEHHAFRLTEDLLLPELHLPSGGLVVGEYLARDDGLDVEVEVAPGRHPVHATLGRYREQDFDTVVLATLVAADAPTVRWELAGAIAVDGGTASFLSVEGRDALADLFDEDEDAWFAFWIEDVYASAAAHDFLGTEIVAPGGHNLVQVASGVGDGGYPVYVGYDAAGSVTRVVVDFILVHLAWPERG